MTPRDWADDLRAASWAVGAARQARRVLSEGGLDDLVLAPPPPLPARAGRGVSLAVRVVARNCLVRAAVRQAWYAAHGRPIDLVIGVTAPAEGFKAHAWLDGDPDGEAAGFRELTRRPAPAGPA